MDDTTKTFLEKIQGIQDKKIKIEGIEGVSECSPLTFKQQKDIISTIAEGNLAALKFQKIINDILIENTKTDLLVTDKLLATLQLRIGSIGTTVKFGDKEVNIRESVEIAKKLKPKIDHTIKTKDIVIELNSPTLKEENKVISSLIESFKGKDNEIAESVGNVYTYEIVKYVKFITYGELVLDVRGIPVKDRVKVIENLPLSINKDIVKFIQEIKKMEADVLKVEVGGTEQSFDIDVSFFDS